MRTLSGGTIRRAGLAQAIVETAAVAGTPYDFSPPGGAPLGSLFLDDCFVDLVRSPDGCVVTEIHDPEAGYGLRVTTDSPGLQAVQVYAPVDSGFIALEPQTNWIDPFGAQYRRITRPPSSSE